MYVINMFNQQFKRFTLISIVRGSRQRMLATLSDYITSWKLGSLCWGIVSFLLFSLSWVAAALALNTRMREVLGSKLG